jgi:hypothetical protein
VKSVHPFQATKVRKNTEVHVSQSSFMRLSNLFRFSKRLYPVRGGFHSHPEWGEKDGKLELSRSDIEYVKNNNSEFEIVMTISTLSDDAPWEVLPGGAIGGSLGGYLFGLAAFKLDVEDKPQQLKLMAPRAIKALNRAQRSAA